MHIHDKILNILDRNNYIMKMATGKNFVRNYLSCEFTGKVSDPMTNSIIIDSNTDETIFYVTHTSSNGNIIDLIRFDFVPLNNNSIKHSILFKQSILSSIQLIEFIVYTLDNKGDIVSKQNIV